MESVKLQAMDRLLIFLDTETTGLSEDDQLIQLAYRTNRGEEVNELFRAEKAISFEAMAAHHITEKMIANKEKFRESVFSERLKNLIEKESAIVVAHNAKFDIEMLKREGIKVPYFIDTLKLARHFDPEGKISSYSLQYLRYLLGIDVEAQAHDAWGDILVLEKLFYRIFKKMKEKTGKSNAEILEEMMEISRKPSFIARISFGKYKGEKLADIAQKDPDYLSWLLREKEKKSDGEEDWIYSIKKALNIL